MRKVRYFAICYGDVALTLNVYPEDEAVCRDGGPGLRLAGPFEDEAEAWAVALRMLAEGPHA